jgi:HAD domain in Swiss Army Knife RNA repair proteins
MASRKDLNVHKLCLLNKRDNTIAGRTMQPAKRCATLHRQTETQPMKIIFLDIDGVLNCKTTPNPRDLPYVVDKRLLVRLKKLLGRTRAKVVLSSTWRIDPVGLFAAKHWGIPFMDVCPDMAKSPRCKEILKWLAQHPKVTRYVVIDDEDDELDGLPLFQPSAKTGITREIMSGVERYLAGKTEHTMRANPVIRLGQNIHSLFKRDKS